MATEARLSAADIDGLRRQLERESRDLKNEINTHLSGSSESVYSGVVDAVRDRGDESVADLFADLELAGIEREVDRLQVVESALHRIGQGAYGVCTDCAFPIGSTRLHADPAVFRCITCQTRVESVPHAGDATPSL